VNSQFCHIRKMLSWVLYSGTLYCFFLCISSQKTEAQDASDYITQANQAFVDQPVYSLQMTVSYFSKQSNTATERTDTLHMTKKNNKLWYQYQDEIICVNSMYSIQVSDRMKHISVTRLSKNKNDFKQPSIIPAIDSSKCRILLHTDKLVRLEYRPGGLFPGVERMIIETDAATGFLKSVDFFYSPAEGILLERISYKVVRFDITSDPDDAVFSESRIISEKKGVFSGVGQRKDYRIVMYQ